MRKRFGLGQAARSGLYAQLPGDPLCDECEVITDTRPAALRPDVFIQENTPAPNI